MIGLGAQGAGLAAELLGNEVELAADGAPLLQHIA